MSDDSGAPRWVRPRLFVIAAVAAGGAAFLCLCLSVGRARLPTYDEIVLVSASRSFGAGGDGTPTIYPASSDAFPLPLLHGPVFYWIQARALTVFGLSPAVSRMVSVVAALVTAAAAAAIVWCASGTAEWAAVAFGLVLLSPEIGDAASSGRMDGLAVGFVTAGLATFLAGMSRRPLRTVAFGLSAGGLWALAMLTTPRVYPFVFGVAVAIGATWRASTSDRRPPAVLLLTTAGAVVGGIALWSAHLGITPVTWLTRTIAATLTVPGVITAPGAERDWVNSILIMSALAIAPPLVVVAWAALTRRLDTRSVFVFTAATTNAAVLALVGGTNFVPIYLGIPLQIAVLAGLGRLWAQRMLPRSVLVWGVLVAAGFGAYRLAKQVEMLQTWEARSASGLNELVRRHVQPGSTVLAYEEFYYYAVERVGARFVERDTWNDRFTAWRRVWKLPTPRPERVRPQYFLWPDSPIAPIPAAFRCAATRPLARYAPRSSRRSLLDPNPGATERSFSRTYPDTVLYEIPADCEPFAAAPAIIQ